MRTLTPADFPAIHRAFLLAFGDYEVPLEMPADALEEMITRRGYEPALSVAEFDGEEIVAFVLNGQGLWKGRRTIYDTGTGVVPTSRGRGLSRLLLRESIRLALEAGLEQYLLEVLQSNKVALDLYSSEGFEIRRELACFAVMSVPPAILPGGIVIRRESELPADCGSFCTTGPSWQNSLASIQRSSADRIILTARNEGRLEGFAVFFTKTADLALLAVRPESRRKGIGAALFAEAMKCADGAPVRAVNIDCTDEVTLGFLERRAREFVRQYEMMRTLTESANNT